MSKEKIREIIYNIIKDIAPDEDLSNLDDTKAIRDQIELDSMDFLDIVLELRKRYKVDVPEEDYPKLATINGCVEYLDPKLKGACVS
ncbi:MAG: acyl carrier protein [Nitrospinota bacterium]|jgi:acyl carrier protein|nr:acyl carrier protein [Nitrospinota bacterium]MDP7580201.1 acyl carrier protein [Nitrospinota bacterium]HJN01806.1 acyl carrier protein [Nitrospinota bacterium]|tara:strand:+ start:1108 stop:1368 length:261 start_codon:yes stop_codon:yes gene_type:complete